MPELNFKGKEFVYNHHLTVPFRPLEPHPDKGIGEPSLDGNLIIHGDNLHALKALLPMYAGKVDCIFIDPPYNTGNEGWCYSDAVNAPMIKEWLNTNPVGVDDGLRHEKWAAMMWPRLRLLWELLSDEGALCVICDDNESARLKAMLDEICGEGAYIATIVWQKVFAKKNKAQISGSHDSIHIYSKKGSKWDRNLLPRSAEQESEFSNRDDDPRGPWQSVSFSVQTEDADKRKDYRYQIELPSGRKVGPPEGRHWNGLPARYGELLKDSRIWFGEAGDSRPRVKVFLNEVQAGIVPDTWWTHEEFGNNQEAKRELNEVFGAGDRFPTPKPMALLMGILSIATKPNSLVLDSFAGSGSTGQAVLKLNDSDGGKRRFILVEMEDYADTLTAERVRRVINGYAFKGTQREELLREPITFTKLKNANALLEKVQQIETLEGPKFDRIKPTVKDGVLIVTGERDCEETAPGLGGTFTYCTLGDAIDMDGLLTGADLPALQSLAALLYHTATSQAFDPGQLKPTPEIGDGVHRLGTANGRHLWLFYKPDLDWLKSAEAALTLSKARAIGATETGDHLVFAPAKFVSRDLLGTERVTVEYAPLPYALYRVETA